VKDWLNGAMENLEDEEEKERRSLMMNAHVSNKRINLRWWLQLWHVGGNV
jgi:hypothetical protein